MVDWMIYALTLAGVAALCILPLMALELLRLSRAYQDLLERNGLQAMMLAAYSAKPEVREAGPAGAADRLRKATARRVPDGEAWGR